MNPTQAGLFGSGRPTPKAARSAYLGRTPNNTFEFCIPSKATAVPIGPDWVHELKYDGYRLRVERDDDRVMRGGYNWASR